MAPAISGYEPKFQALGVNVLWICLVIIVVGSFAGQWLAVMQRFGLEKNFWFGLQGWEYADTDRLLPLGTMQLLAAINQGYWFARSHDFMQQPIVDLLVWMRVPGDTIFSIGALALTYFVIRLWIRPEREGEVTAEAPLAGGEPEDARPVPAE